MTVDDKLNPAQEAYIRIAKLLIFGLFVYCGASVGSFLNVVAECIPRGNSFIARSSACPRCGIKIRRSDNLPLFGYLRLKGRCRACSNHIPLRYLMVEVIGAAIFGSLFLFELITGAANVPGFREYAYKGVVWIVLYTKWDVIAIYFFHAMFLSVIMCVALIDMNRERAPIWFSVAIVLGFAILAIVSEDLAPHQLGREPSEGLFPRLLWTLLAIPLGSIFGWLLKIRSERASANDDQRFKLAILGEKNWGLTECDAPADRMSSLNLSLAMVLCAIVVGWYPTLLVFVLSLLLIPLADRFMKQCHLGHISLSVWIVFLLVWVHHPFWEWLLVASARIAP